MKKIKVKFLKEHHINGEKFAKDAVAALPEAFAKHLIESGSAELADKGE